MRRHEALTIAQQAGRDWAERYCVPPDLHAPHGISKLAPAEIAEEKASLATWIATTNAAAKAAFEAQVAADVNIRAFGHSAAYVEAAMANVAKVIQTQASLTVIAGVRVPGGG